MKHTNTLCEQDSRQFNDPHLSRLPLQSKCNIKLDSATNHSGTQSTNLSIDDNSMVERLEAVLSYFCLGTVRHIERIGGINTNYAITTDSGEFVLKFLFHHPLEIFKKELVYLNRLRE